MAIFESFNGNVARFERMAAMKRPVAPPKEPWFDLIHWDTSDERCAAYQESLTAKENQEDDEWLT